MADISKIQLPNGNTYNLKDSNTYTKEEINNMLKVITSDGVYDYFYASDDLPVKIKGIIIERLGDKAISVSGTATDDINELDNIEIGAAMSDLWYSISDSLNLPMFFSFCPYGGSTSTFYVEVIAYDSQYNETILNDTGEGVTIPFTPYYILARLIVKSGVTIESRFSGKCIFKDFMTTEVGDQRTDASAIRSNFLLTEEVNELKTLTSALSNTIQTSVFTSAAVMTQAEYDALTTKTLPFYAIIEE